MRLTRFADYSLRVLMHLAITPDRLCTVKEVAQNYQISQNHLVKIVNNLSHLGYIESRKGKGGGIRLLKEADSINLCDLIVNLEPNLNLVECFDDRTNTCNIAGACGLKNILHESMKSFTDTLGNYTLADTVCKLKLTDMSLKAGKST